MDTNLEPQVQGKITSGLMKVGNLDLDSLGETVRGALSPEEIVRVRVNLQFFSTKMKSCLSMLFPRRMTGLYARLHC